MRKRALIYFMMDKTIPDEPRFLRFEDHESVEYQHGFKPIDSSCDELIVKAHKTWATPGKEFYGQMDTTEPWFLGEGYDYEDIRRARI